MKVQKPVRFFLIVFFTLMISQQSAASSVIRLNIKTILASQKSGDIDPSLRSLANELQTVFKYSSYRLLKQDDLNLKLKESGQVSLPDNLIMKITPMALSGDRSTINLEILSGNRTIFQTVIRLLNKSSITVGGPKHQGGYLLFNIYNSF